MNLVRLLSLPFQLLSSFSFIPRTERQRRQRIDVSSRGFSVSSRSESIVVVVNFGAGGRGRAPELGSDEREEEAGLMKEKKKQAKEREGVESPGALALCPRDSVSTAVLSGRLIFFLPLSVSCRSESVSGSCTFTSLGLATGPNHPWATRQAVSILFPS